MTDLVDETTTLRVDLREVRTDVDAQAVVQAALGPWKAELAAQGLEPESVTFFLEDGIRGDLSWDPWLQVVVVQARCRKVEPMADTLVWEGDQA